MMARHICSLGASLVALNSCIVVSTVCKRAVCIFRRCKMWNECKESLIFSISKYFGHRCLELSRL